MSKIKIITLYLPQFYPIPENDEWWGKGFTEWVNTAKAKPIFRGHYQPHIPADLGFYDLRVPETRRAQADIAKNYGVDAFCYYHYWFAGKRILERPFTEVLESGEPNFPFCLCWANQTWTGIWHGEPERILIEQTYPGENDHKNHFNVISKAFEDKRYITVDGKPIFLIYKPNEIPEVEKLTMLWRRLAKEKGFNDLYMVGFHWDSFWASKHGFDAILHQRLPKLISNAKIRNVKNWIKWKFRVLMKRPTIYSYQKIYKQLIPKGMSNSVTYPCVIPNWDNTPRSGVNGLVLEGSTPSLFRLHLQNAVEFVKRNPEEKRIIFIKSWNEWAEGNHLEPDLKHGLKYLEVIKEEKEKLLINDRDH